MKQSVQLAFQPSVVKRALKFAVVVGIVLITINHSDAILQGHITRTRLLRMGLTVLVPYVVSTLSSVGALRDYENQLNKPRMTRSLMKSVESKPPHGSVVDQ